MSVYPQQNPRRVLDRVNRPGKFSSSDAILGCVKQLPGCGQIWSEPRANLITCNYVAIRAGDVHVTCTNTIGRPPAREMQCPGTRSSNDAIECSEENTRDYLAENCTRGRNWYYGKIRINWICQRYQFQSVLFIHSLSVLLYMA